MTNQERILKQLSKITFEKLETAVCHDINKTRLLFSKKDELSYWDYRICSKCGLVFISPRPIESDQLKIYNVYADYDFTTEEGLKQRFSIKPSRFQKTILRGIRSKRKLGRLLDVGCAEGGWLNRVQTEGWDCCGVEPCFGAAENARKLGFKVYDGHFLSADINKYNLFDVITMNDVFDHVHDPWRILKKARKLLRPKGLVVISVMNYNSLERYLCHKEWCHFTVGHLYYFSEKSIRFILNENGFKLVKIKTMRNTDIPYTLKCCWRRITHRDIPLPKKRLSILDRLVNRIFSYPLNFCRLGPILTVFAEKV